MSTLHVKTRSGQRKQLTETSDLSVMEVLRFNGIDEMLALCGGCCSCATCHVYVDQKWLSLLPPMSQSENELLEGSEHRTELSRLSCQLRFSTEVDGLGVTIAPED